jgi:hypothetical protein
MTRSIAIASLIGLALLLAGRAQADRLGKGRSLVFVGIGGHRGQFVYPGAPPLGTERDEVGGEIAYCRFLSAEWTLGVSGGYHAGREKIDENDLNGTHFATETFETHSFTARIGGDRYAFIDDNVALYAGPGMIFTRGRYKDNLTVIPPTVGGGTNQGPNATEVGLNGRIGMYARLGKGTALFGHIGQVLSRTSGKDSGGKVSWWSSTPEGAVGLAFDF